MPTSAFASLLIAFVAAAGAVPLLRDLLRDRPTVRSAGAVAMALGVAVAAFYSDPWPASDRGLIFGAAALVLAGLALDARLAGAGGATVRRIFEVVGTLVAGVFLFTYLEHDRVTWSVGFMMLAAVSLLLPIATAALDRLPSATPSLPAGMVMVQLLLLMFFGAANADGGSRYSLYAEFAIVALPVIGALLGCLVYLSSMPWRTRPGVALGTGGLLALGFMISWGALRLGSITAEVRGGTTALLWLVAVPVFEFVRESVGRLAGRMAAQRWLQQPGSAGLRHLVQAVCNAHYSPAALLSIQAALGLAGIGLCKLDTSGYFLTLALLALGVAYMLVPVYLTWRRPAASLGRAAYSQHGGDRA